MENSVTQTFTRLIEKQEERQYLRIPFTMEEDVETLTISYEYTRHRLSPGGEGKTLRREVNILDLALEDPYQSLVGASGSERREVTIHENHATPGYRGVPLCPGTWFIVLGAYQIQKEGCPVTLSIVQRKKAGVLLKGDCHTHTVHSDGWYTVDEVIDRARQDKLDFLFITDHNSMASNPFIRSLPGLTVLPGVEATYYDGHYNLFGVERPIQTYVANSRDEVLSIMKEGRERGALTSLNHPFDQSCPWKFGFGPDVPADMVEIWNGPYTSFNQKNIDFWHSQLMKGRIWPAIGGSDCHHSELFRTFAAPATFLYARSNSGSDILEAMKSGHAFIGMHTSAPTVYMAMGNARMGDIHIGEKEPLYLRVESLADGDEIILLNQNGELWNSNPGACWQFETSIDPGESIFLRLEVRRTLPGGIGTLASISNPIYIR